MRKIVANLSIVISFFFVLSKSVINRNPFVILLLPIIAGTIIGFYNRNNFDYTMSFGLLFTFSLLFAAGFKNLRNSLLFNVLQSSVLLLMIGLLEIMLTQQNLKREGNAEGVFKSKTTKIFVEIRNVKESGDNYLLECEIIYFENSTEKEISGNNLLIFIPQEYNNDEIIPGNRIWVYGELTGIKPGAFPNSFDWQHYYSLKSIFYQLNVRSVHHLQVDFKEHLNLKAIAFNIRYSLKKRLNRLFVKQESVEILKAIIIGNKEGMHEEVRTAFSKSGVMHVLAVSGLHVGIIYLLLKSILLFFFKSSKGLVFFTLLLFGIWLYALITGLSSSVTRASFMFSIIALGESLNRRSGIYNTLACSAFFILCINPLRLFDLGFQLSYSAVLGIVSIYPILDQLFQSKYWIIQKIWSSLSVSVAAQIGTLPLVLYYFHSFPVYFFLSNLIAIPAIAFFIISGFVIISLSFIPSAIWIAEGMSIILDHLVYYLFSILQYIAQFPGSSISVTIDKLQLILAYFFLFSLIFSLYFAKKKLLLLSLFFASFFLIHYNIRKLFAEQPPHLYLANVRNNLYLGIKEKDDHIIMPLFFQTIDMKQVNGRLNNYWLENNLSIPLLDTSRNYNAVAANSCTTIRYNGINILLINIDGTSFTVDSGINISAADLIIIRGKYNDVLLEEIKRNGNTTIFTYNMANYSFNRWSDSFDDSKIEINRLRYNDFIECYSNHFGVSSPQLAANI